MLYHKKYTINPSDIVDGAIRWQATGSGVYVVAEHKGSQYFVKRFTMGPRIPSESIPEPVYSEQLAIAKWLEEKQAKMRKLFKGLTVKDDHIVVEEENFWDEDNLFTTVTQMIPNEVEDFDYTALDQATFVKLCQDMALLIKKTHDAGVTHGDLKDKNILIQFNGGSLVPYLIDFDSSYPSDYATRKGKDGKPLLAHPVVFSEGYQSPEIAIYNNEDQGVIDAATITCKTDIFTLAIIFHKLWTGNFPAVIGDSCPVGEAVYCDTPIKIDAKFNVSLGTNNDCKFSSLLMWMLAKDAEKRPTAQQVIDALADEIDIDDMFETSDSAAKFDLEPHEIHKAALEIYTKETLKKKDVKSFLKITEGGKYKYYVKLKDGTERKITVDEVIACGYGKAKKITICSLWEEDENNIELLSLDDISKLGIVAIEPKTAGYRRFYFVALRAGGGYTTSASGLVDNGIARRKIIAADPDFDINSEDTPWPEHGDVYDQKALKSRHVIKVEKVTENGEHKYLLTMKDDKGKKQNVVKVEYMRIMMFIKRSNA